LTLDQIVEETKQLPADVVAELVDRILVARHGGIEPGVETAWKTEIAAKKFRASRSESVERTTNLR
jgi:hypothetical protein